MLFQILQVSSVLLYMLNKKDTRGEVISACQFKSKKTGKPYWAIEVKWEPLELKVPILRKGEIPLPVPELGKVLHGFQFTTSYLEIEKLNNPENFNGVICHYRVNEITRTYDDEYCRRSFYIEGGKQNAEYSKKKLKTIIEDSVVDGLVSNKFQQLLRRNIKIKDKDKAQNTIKKLLKNQQKFCMKFGGVESLTVNDFREWEKEHLEEQRSLLRQYSPDIRPEDYETIIKSMNYDDESEKPEKPEILITEKTLGDGTPITIKSRSVDHHSNRKEMATALLRKDYPNFFNARDGLSRAKDETERKKWAEKARQGFIVDFKKNTGIQLNAEDATELLKDNDFIKMLNEANEKPGKKQNIVAWEIIIYWIKKGYYKMKNQDLAAAVFKATGEKLKGTTLAKRVGRLGLKTALKRGRPEKKEELF